MSMYYLPNASNQQAQGGGNNSLSVVKQDTFTSSIQRRRESNSPNRPSVDGAGDPTSLDNQNKQLGKTPVIAPGNPDVNEYIVKIEMKKFQNLIENRIKHKNNLTQADMVRVYPLT